MRVLLALLVIALVFVLLQDSKEGMVPATIPAPYFMSPPVVDPSVVFMSDRDYRDYQHAQSLKPGCCPSVYHKK